MGAAALSSPVWRHARVRLPRTTTAAQVTLRTFHHPATGAVGLDNIVFSAGTKCHPAWTRTAGYRLHTDFDKFWKFIPKYGTAVIVVDVRPHLLNIKILTFVLFVQSFSHCGLCAARKSM